MVRLSSKTIERQREAVWAEAETWLRTPWMHRQALKGVGVDCGRLLIACYADAGVIEAFEPPRYSPDWSLHQRGEWMQALIEQFGVQVPEERAGKGGTVLFRYGHNFSHAGIIGAGSQMIHAYRSKFAGSVQLGDYMAEEEFRAADKVFYVPRAWA